jgi:hypothetical protein
LLFEVKRTKYINWILGLRQTTFVALFYYQVYETLLNSLRAKQYQRKAEMNLKGQPAIPKSSLTCLRMINAFENIKLASSKVIFNALKMIFFQKI